MWLLPERPERGMRDIERAEPRPKMKLVKCEKCGSLRIAGGHHSPRIVARDGGFVRVDCVGAVIDATAPVST